MTTPRGVQLRSALPIRSFCRAFVAGPISVLRQEDAEMRDKAIKELIPYGYTGLTTVEVDRSVTVYRSYRFIDR